MATIANGKDVPLNVQTGTIPNLSGALQDWFQPMVFMPVVKETVGFQVIETGDPISFRGVIQPMSGRALEQKPEGERGWTWWLLHSDTALPLDVDDVVTYLGVQTRIMRMKPFGIYGYYEYELVQDWTGSGPVTP